MMSQFFVRLYFAFARWLSTSTLLSWVGVNPERVRAFKEPLRLNRVSRDSGSIWVHAASSGELEMLIPIVDRLYSQGHPVCVSAFSASALPFLSRIEDKTHFAGLSPREDLWKSALIEARASRVVVSKYEAWPGLWMACQELGIPIVVINARWRASLRFIHLWFWWIRRPLPRLLFYVNSLVFRDPVASEFGDAQIHLGVDPRLERILHRAHHAQEHLRVAYWKTQIDALPSTEPVLMVGSAWPRDIRKLLRACEHLKVMPRIVICPHRVDSVSIQAIQDEIDKEPQARIRENCLIIPEMGILIELYSLADRIFVGGGFSKGVHSTLEAGVYSVPVACGRTHIEWFDEIPRLRQAGVLTVCSGVNDLEHWLDDSEVQAHEPHFLHEHDQEELTNKIDVMVEELLRFR